MMCNKERTRNKIKPYDSINEVINTKTDSEIFQNNRQLPPRPGTARHFGAPPTSATVTGADGLLPASPSSIPTTSKVNSTPYSIVSSPGTASPNTSTASTVSNVFANIHNSVSAHR